MSNKKRIGELLVEAGYVTPEQLEQALRIQVGGTRRLGRIFLRMGAITSDQLVEVLSRHLDLPITDLSKAVQSRASRVLPRYLCKRYGVLPLDVVHGQILNLAMTDPSDADAVRDVEAYTGMVVRPFLARNQDITSGISRSIPLSLGDLQNPSTMATLGKTVFLVSLVLILVLSVLSYQFYSQTRYGDRTRSDDRVLYSNHDLIIGYATSGDVTLLGRGAYADGFYSITFQSVEDFLVFTEAKKADFSMRQREWILWTLAAKR